MKTRTNRATVLTQPAADLITAGIQSETLGIFACCGTTDGPVNLGAKSVPVRERGFVMVTAVIFLVILSVLGIMMLRGTLFDERMAANDRELTLAREYAEMALRDAERDILGLRFDGTYCASVCATTARRTASTRPVSADDAKNFWAGEKEGETVAAIFDGGSGQDIGVYSFDAAEKCGKSIWSAANWTDGVTRKCVTGSETDDKAVLPTVPYGQFTEAPFNVPDNANIPRPRYMIEYFPGAQLVGGGGIWAPGGGSRKKVFRITAVGFGRTTSPTGERTSVTLQSVFTPN